ncbi:MAG: hypothetical protein KAQ83_03930 [Nanoarchaeota archaeon]|nr:hypothetical protein [Nanoarchaeota archaeon]
MGFHKVEHAWQSINNAIEKLHHCISRDNDSWSAQGLLESIIRNLDEIRHWYLDIQEDEIEVAKNLEHINDLINSLKHSESPDHGKLKDHLENYPKSILSALDNYKSNVKKILSILKKKNKFDMSIFLGVTGGDLNILGDWISKDIKFHNNEKRFAKELVHLSKKVMKIERSEK